MGSGVGWECRGVLPGVAESGPEARTFKLHSGRSSWVGAYVSPCWEVPWRVAGLVTDPFLQVCA